MKSRINHKTNELFYNKILHKINELLKKPTGQILTGQTLTEKDDKFRQFYS